MANNIPEVRFEGFSGEWEESKLGEIFNQTVEYVNPRKSNLELWSVTVQSGLTPKTDRYNRDALVKKIDKFKAVHSGEIVYNPMNITIGAVGFNRLGKSVAVSGYYVTMSMNEGSSNSYFGTWLTSANAIKKYKLYATGSLIEKQRVQFPTLSSIKVHIPSFEEQSQIGSFFKQLDDSIALQQQELDTLKQTKKGFLQKMFPKEGETVPEVRFPGFSGAWERKKAKDLCSISTGRGNTQDKVESGIYPFYVRSATIERSDDYLYDQEAVLTVGDGVGTGKVFHYVNGKYNLHQRVYRMYDFKDDMITKYFYYYFSNHFYRRVMAMTAKTSVDSVRMDMIAEMQIFYPCLKEQLKIVNLLDDLESSILFNQQELDAMKETKKAFLQKMFV